MFGGMKKEVECKCLVCCKHTWSLMSLAFRLIKSECVCVCTGKTDGSLGCGTVWVSGRRVPWSTWVHFGSPQVYCQCHWHDQDDSTHQGPPSSPHTHLEEQVGILFISFRELNFFWLIQICANAHFSRAFFWPEQDPLFFFLSIWVIYGSMYSVLFVHLAGQLSRCLVW